MTEDSEIRAHPRYAACRDYVMRYLGRYAASSNRLREKLLAWAQRQFPEDDVSFIADSLVDQLQKLKVLDDGELARQRSAYLVRRGHAPAVIRRKLTDLGLTADLVSETMRSISGTDEGSAHGLARQYAKRRKLGPYRHNHRFEPSLQMQKDLRTMIQAGFSPYVARAILQQRPETTDQD